MSSEYNEDWKVNYINNLIKEIVKECLMFGVDATIELVSQIMKLKILSHKIELTQSMRMSRAVVEKLIRSCVQDLMQTSPALDCIRIQAYWNNIPSQLERVKQLYNTRLTENSAIAFEEIIREKEIDKILKKILHFIEVFTDMGRQNTIHSMKETINPLKSVFKQSQMNLYLTLTREGKFEYLTILGRLVSGICIYQKYFKKGSESIDDAPLRLLEATKSVANDVTSSIQKLSSRSDIIVQELKIIHGIGLEKRHIPEGFDNEDIKELQQIHHTMLQHQKVLKNVSVHLEEYSNTIQIMVTNLRESLEALQNEIGDREAIPTSPLYDHFINIYDQWSALQAESLYLNCLDMLIKNIKAANKYLPPTKLELALKYIRRKPEINVQEDSKNFRIPQDYHQDLSVIDITDGIVLQFQGYCAWTIFQTDGSLIPALTNIGIIEYKGKYYGFCSKEAGELWQSDPESHVRCAYETIRRNSQLVDLLEEYDYLHTHESWMVIGGEPKTMVKKQDRCCQTELHPIPAYHDKDYSFSEWQLRNRALQLSRLIKCTTKSVQTTKHSHFRASIGIQCAPDRTRGTETMTDKACVHETIGNFIYGLRGRYNEVQVLSLTQPIQRKLQTSQKEEKCERQDTREPCKSINKEWTNLMRIIEPEEDMYMKIIMRNQPPCSDCS